MVLKLGGWVGSCDVATASRWVGGRRWRGWRQAWWVCGGRKGKEDVPDPARHSLQNRIHKNAGRDEEFSQQPKVLCRFQRRWLEAIGRHLQ